jgi:hypothetical protein
MMIQVEKTAPVFLALKTFRKPVTSVFFSRAASKEKKHLDEFFLSFRGSNAVESCILMPTLSSSERMKLSCCWQEMARKKND